MPEDSQKFWKIFGDAEKSQLENAECYNDAIYYREEIREQFKHGKISSRAPSDNI